MDTRISSLGFVGSICGGPPLSGKEIRNGAFEVVADRLKGFQGEVLGSLLDSRQGGF
jgi:hypothetical protein